ncbi:FAD-dependent oxidoreductase [Herbiconiux daphne]|uniref:FAD-dependent monooxygenase n=1 Tax=Herbiconiux daphne TaxID=2970914 RepID=A0ABT2H729_9MICO|nr:NAD(P)/FAD-dependent oxidoreductase [Herbiconiux daphne]MCS5735748.1 FAD-dependent monooxygenase [Herbiconiux daphne]
MQELTSVAHTSRTVAVIGAGIGGAAAALALNKAGVDVQLYDQAPAFAEVGGTILIDSYTVGVLREMGVAEEVLAVTAPVDEVEMRHMNGEFILKSKIPDVTDLGVDVQGRTGFRELFGIQRSDLHAVLLRHLPDERTHTNKKLVRVLDQGSFVEAEFEDGTIIRPDVLIGADGIRSAVRRLLVDVEAESAGVVICRSLATADVLPDDWANDRMRRWQHKTDDGGSVNALFAPTRGGRYVGVDVSLYGGDQLLDLEVGNIVPLERLLSCFPDDADPVVLDALRASVVEIRAYPLRDLPEVQSWTSSRVALVGDAAHAMRPLLGQGANQAIQDAYELARCLADPIAVEEALNVYEEARAPFVKAIARAAREFRPDYVALLQGPPASGS